VDRAERLRAEQRARLQAAEVEAFAHYGIDATSEPLVLEDPPLTTRVVRVGSGPPTVLFHGSTLTSTVWAPLLPHLPGRSLHLVDLPGCGLADPFDYEGVDLAAHQEAFVSSVLDALGLDRATLIGASMGGWFVLRFAIERPERVVAAARVTAPANARPG
jgi:pimeloyl-ACP methyl ester carboxylesterase